MPEVLTSGEAAVRILADLAPVLILDTCAILDIIRAPIREQIYNIKAALSILTASRATPRELWVVVPNLVLSEFDDNIITVEGELNKSLLVTDSRVVEINAALSLLGLQAHAGLADFSSSGLTQSLRSIADEVITIALQIDDDECSSNAVKRVILGKAPSEKGKQQLKDCIIWENAIAFSSKLRRLGFNRPVVFISSNTSDYCSDKKLKPELQAELNAFQGSFATHLSWGLAEARK